MPADQKAKRQTGHSSAQAGTRVKRATRTLMNSGYSAVRRRNEKRRLNQRGVLKSGRGSEGEATGLVAALMRKKGETLNPN